MVSVLIKKNVPSILVNTTHARSQELPISFPGGFLYNFVQAVSKIIGLSIKP